MILKLNTIIQPQNYNLNLISQQFCYNVNVIIINNYSGTIQYDLKSSGYNVFYLQCFMFFNKPTVCAVKLLPVRAEGETDASAVSPGKTCVHVACDKQHHSGSDSYVGSISFITFQILDSVMGCRKMD